MTGGSQEGDCEGMGGEGNVMRGRKMCWGKCGSGGDCSVAVKRRGLNGEWWQGGVG